VGSHVLLLAVFSLFVSVVFSALMQGTLRQQLTFGATMFAGLVISAIILGWLMYPFPL
jgi:hypothetical protein